jgi:hypothetical protein
VLWPLLEPIGWCDHWLAWGLYAPRNSRTDLFIHDVAVAALPANLQPFLEADNDTDWRQLYLDRWSLAARDVPIYPQARVQLGVAEAVIRRYDLRAFQVVLLGPARRLTGAREHDTLRIKSDVERASHAYFLNSRSPVR